MIHSSSNISVGSYQQNDQQCWMRCSSRYQQQPPVEGETSEAQIAGFARFSDKTNRGFHRLVKRRCDIRENEMKGKERKGGEMLRRKKKRRVNERFIKLFKKLKKYEFRSYLHHKFSATNGYPLLERPVGCVSCVRALMTHHKTVAWP